MKHSKPKPKKCYLWNQFNYIRLKQFLKVMALFDTLYAISFCDMEVYPPHGWRCCSSERTIFLTLLPNRYLVKFARWFKMWPRLILFLKTVIATHTSVFNVLTSGVSTFFPTYWNHPDVLFKKAYGWWCIHFRTVCMTVSPVNLMPCKSDLSLLNRQKTLRAKSGLYGGCVRRFHVNF